MLDAKSARGLKTGTATYRLVRTLISDFYRPLPAAELHAQVYPKQYFNPLTSPNRIHKLVGRLRQVLAKKNIPVEIKVIEGKYKLHLPYGNGISVSMERYGSRGEALLSSAIQFMLTKESFIREDLSNHLKISRSSANRLILEAEKRQIIEKIGATKSAYYRLRQSVKAVA